MKELQEKSKELNMMIGAHKRTIENIKNDIEELKAKKESFLGAEITLKEYQLKVQELEKKVQIINDAEDILLGIGI